MIYYKKNVCMVIHYGETFLAKRIDHSHIQELRKCIQSPTLEKPRRYLQNI
jgi:hypothetical protein